jgi:hypothetical protein
MLHVYEFVSDDGSPQLPRDVRVVGYSYALVGRNETEILVFHWHPDGRSPITEPHLHIKTSLVGVELSKSHVPTGIVSAQSFLQFLIRDLRVEPLCPGWQAILNDSPSAA